jgi:diguanylate cyclase (GGDEF)-like protein
MPLKSANLEDFPESDYAAELRRRSSALRFPPALEDQFLDEHIRRVTLRARIWSTLGVLLGIGFTVAQWLQDRAWTGVVLAHVLVIIPVSLAMAWLCWLPGHMRSYLRAARYLVPVLGINVAIAVAHAISRDAPEQLAMLSLFLIATFFFTGLRIRAASLAAAATLAAFAVAAPLLGVPTPLYAKCLVFVGIAAALGATIGRDVERSYRKRFLEQGLINELVERDGLTGLKNRRAFDEYMVRVWQQSLRGNGELAFLIIDIDHFKLYNDRYGHQAGDAALRKVADVVREFARRPFDIAARYGGEEFVIVVYDVSALAIPDFVERLRAAVEAIDIEHADADTGRLTVSIGAGIVRPVIGRTPKGALQLADESLYRAKQSGRNCCVIAGQEQYEALVTGSYRNPADAKRR